MVIASPVIAAPTRLPLYLPSIRYQQGRPDFTGVLQPGNPAWLDDIRRAVKNSPFLDAHELNAGVINDQARDFLSRLGQQNGLLDRNFRSNYPYLSELARSVGSPRAEKTEPQIFVLRANGKKINKKPEWKTGDAPSQDAEVLKLVGMIQEAARFYEALLQANPVVQKYAPDLSFLSRPFVVILGYNPKDDGQGYANASCGMDKNGNIMVVVGENPPEGSPAAQFLNPILNEPKVIFHELGHALLSVIMAYTGNDLEYINLSGGYNESLGDLMALGATQFVTENGGVFKGLDQPGRLFLSAEDYVLGDGWLKAMEGQPVYLRNILEPGETNRNRGHFLGIDLQRPNIVESLKALIRASRWVKINHDRGGVHVYSSFDNRRGAMEAFVHDGGNLLNVIQHRIGAILFMAMTGMDQISPPEAALLESMAAYMSNPDKSVIDRKVDATAETGFFNDLVEPDENRVKEHLENLDQAYKEAKALMELLRSEGRSFDPRRRHGPLRKTPR